MDPLHKFLNFIDYNRYKLGGAVAVGLATYVMIGCASTAPSLINDGEQVTRDELAREVVIIDGGFAKRRAAIDLLVAELNQDIEQQNQLAALAVGELDRQDEQKVQVAEFLGGVVNMATSGASPGNILASVLNAGLFGAMATAWGDGRRKDNVIENLKAGATATA